MKALLLSLFLAFAADVPLEDPALEARAQALMREVRCVACENEPVSQSSAAIAEDMRARIREMIADGASDQEVRDWFESRYGEFVLFRPKGQGFSGFFLWGGPFILLVSGLLIGWLTAKQRRSDAAAPVESEDA
ncbi:MAG: cytochrome c-type biogenesis protein CcmH [Hyphomonas sp.]|nr:cytochrome c-type biogenesis protein CcmH [Hyphomonas sp.]